MADKKIIAVRASQIDRGIQVYGGEIDHHLQAVIKGASLEYTPYVFKDGRILLVLPNRISAFLYSDRDELYKSLSLG